MKEIITWDKAKLSVQVDAMDREHQTLIAIMNKLYDRHSANAPATELEGLLRDLGNYTVKHFTDEERYMASIAYSGIESHKRIHAELLKTFQQHVAAFTKARKLEEAFFQFLKMWLQAHIQGIDRKYGEVPNARMPKSA